MKILSSKYYRHVVFMFFLFPNLFVVLLGIESFPLTCAPMFGHYINKKTPLYLFKLEGKSDSATINLMDHLGKSDDYFMRHFFSKAYGATTTISPFANRLSDSPKEFEHRMNVFFANYSNFLRTKEHLTVKRINLLVKQVNASRESLSNYQMVGYYDVATKTYHKALTKK